MFRESVYIIHSWKILESSPLEFLQVWSIIQLHQNLRWCLLKWWPPHPDLLNHSPPPTSTKTDLGSVVHYWMVGSLLEPQMLFCDVGDLDVCFWAWLYFTEKAKCIFSLISDFNVLFLSPFLYQWIMALITPVLLFFFFFISLSFWFWSILRLALVKLLESSFVTSGLASSPWVITASLQFSCCALDTIKWSWFPEIQ